MEQSLFLQYVRKYFPGIVVSVTDKLNDTKNPLTYRYRTMLRREFSVTGKWESISSSNTLVMADIVAMDSSLPLKKRDRISKANGDIPKMGLELKLNERQLTDLDTLVAQSGNDPRMLNQILAKLFEDTPRAIGGVYERIERMLLEGLSTGVTLIEDTENVGIGVRIDYGYPTDHKFGVTAAWTGTSFKPFDDIDRVLDKARTDGNVPIRVMTDKATINKIAATDQAKELYAFRAGFVGSNIPQPSLTQLNAYTSDRYNFVFEEVERSVRYEKNGVQTAIKPWEPGAMVFLSGNQVGTLVWAKLAEMNHPVQNVSYETADEFILVSKYRLNKPSLSEYTSSQARVVPVIANVDQIYLLDTTTVQA